MFVFSNDTDVICLLLRYMDQFQRIGLKELYAEFGKPNRMLPIHKFKLRIGNEFFKHIVKAHIVTGTETISKIGTKHAALAFNPDIALSLFGESPVLTESDLINGEQYLVKVWHGVKSTTNARTFDELRLNTRQSLSKSVIPLDAYPPTSSVMRGHLRRCFYEVKTALTLLADPPNLDPLDFGWEELDGIMVPHKCLNEMDEKLTKVCGCGGKCNTNVCSCKKSKVKCTVYCHKIDANLPCVNTTDG